MANLLFDHLESTIGPVVPIENDHFWLIDAAERREVYVEPTELFIGQVSECWSNLRKVSTDPQDALNYHLKGKGLQMESDVRMNRDVGNSPDLAPKGLRQAWLRLHRYAPIIGEWWRAQGRGRLYIHIEVDAPGGDYQSEAVFRRGDCYAFVVFKADEIADVDPDLTAMKALRQAIRLAARRVRIEPLELDDFEADPLG